MFDVNIPSVLHQITKLVWFRKSILQGSGCTLVNGVLPVISMLFAPNSFNDMVTT